METRSFFASRAEELGLLRVDDQPWELPKPRPLNRAGPVRPPDSPGPTCFYFTKAGTAAGGTRLRGRGRGRRTLCSGGPSVCCSRGHRLFFPFGANQTALGFAAWNSAVSYQLQYPIQWAPLMQGRDELTLLETTITCGS